MDGQGKFSAANGDVLVRYRNRAIREADLEVLRATLASNSDLGRLDLSRLICRAWDWRQSNGQWAEYACRDLLLRLEEWGHLHLPASHGSRAAKGCHRRYPRLPADLTPLAWLPVRDPDADLDTLEVRSIAPEERLGWRLFMQRFHYLGCEGLIGEHLLYAAFVDRELAALIGWAAAALHVPARDRFIGWDEETKRRRLHLVANNVRFLVLPHVRVKHLASKVLARNLRRLSSDWQARYGHPLVLAETFVDTARFRATCYRASNWRCLGQTAGRGKRGNAYTKHGVRKAIYVYPLHRRAIERLRAPAQTDRGKG